MSAPTTTTTASTDRTRHGAPASAPPRRPIAVRGAASAAVAGALNVVLWLIGRAADVGFVVPDRDGGSPVEVGALHVILTTLVAFTAGTLLFALVGTRSRRWRLGVMALAVLVTGGSLAMPLALDTDAWTRTLLAAMHLLAGAVFVSAMARTQTGATSRQT